MFNDITLAEDCLQFVHKSKPVAFDMDPLQYVVKFVRRMGFQNCLKDVLCHVDSIPDRLQFKFHQNLAQVFIIM